MKFSKAAVCIFGGIALAANSHNAQMWNVILSLPEKRVVLSVDENRSLNVVDEKGCEAGNRQVRLLLDKTVPVCDCSRTIICRKIFIMQMKTNSI